MALAEENPWKAFESIDYCMIGDSRVSGFSIYGFLDQTRVFAEDGAVITMMRDYYTSFEALSPERVFISFGINDMLTGIWNGPEVYAAAVLVISFVWAALYKLRYMELVPAEVLPPGESILSVLKALVPGAFNYRGAFYFY